MEDYKLFKIGSKRVGFLVTIVAAVVFVASMIYSNFNAIGMETNGAVVIIYRAVDIALVWGTVVGTGLALVGIGKAGENTALKIKEDNLKK